MEALKKLQEISARLETLSRELEGVRRELLEHGGATKGDASHGAPFLGAIGGFLQLSQGVSKDELLKMVLRCAMYVTEAGGAGLTLWDRRKNKLVFKEAIGDGAEGLIGLEVPLEGSVHGLVVHLGDAQFGQPKDRTVDEKTGVKFHSVLAAPLVVGEEVVGTMSAVNKVGGGDFTQKDKDAYMRFAPLAAQVVRQRFREEGLIKLIKCEGALDPDLPESLACSESDLLLLKIGEHFGELSAGSDDFLPLLHRLSALMVELTMRARRTW
jgi:hypothetical protein